jgi:ABC-2 type transport system permease protein
LGACLVIGGLCAAAMAANGLPAADCLAAGLGFGLVGCVFAALGLLTSQFARASGAASGAALGIMAAFYIIRVVGDMPRAGGTAPSWLSPFAWAQQTRAFHDLRWWPLALAAAATVLLIAAAFAGAARRDLGAGLGPRRPVAPGAPAWLRSPLALTARLNLGSWLGWTASSVILGATCAPVAAGAQAMLAENKQWAELLGLDQAALTEAFLSMLVFLCALLGVCFAVQSLGRAAAAEAAGTLEVTLAAPVSRRRVFGARAVAAVGGGGLVCLAGALAVGLGAQFAGAGDWLELSGAGLAYLPVVALFSGIGLALYGFAPRSNSLTWALVAYGAVASLFGEVLRLPDWAVELGGFGAVGLVPATPWAPERLALIAAAGLAAGGLGLWRFRRRDIPA